MEASRDYQISLTKRIQSAVGTGKRRICVGSPTGSGKSHVEALIALPVVEAGGRVIVTVPRLTLIRQMRRALQRAGFGRIGVIQSDHPRRDPSAPVQVASLQTLSRRDVQHADIVLVDECHMEPDRIYALMDNPAWTDTPIVGFTATPWRRGMKDHWDELILGPSTLELIDRKFLVPHVVFAPSKPDLRGVHMVAGNFREDELAVVCDTNELVADIIETWLKRARLPCGRGLPTIAYCVNRPHAQHVRDRFIEAGITAEYMDCFTSRDERDAIFDRFARGETTVITDVSVAVDLTMTGCIIDARPTRSETRYVQSLGRGLRPHPGKERLIILDHAGNTQRLGFVTHISHDELLDSKPIKKKPNGAVAAEGEVKLCPECKAVAPRAVRICPECGFESSPPKPVREREGELVELKVFDRLLKVASTRESQWFSMLQTYGARRGYKAGWAAWKFKEKFGYWPAREVKATATTIEPNDEVLAFINAAKHAWVQKQGPQQRPELLGSWI